MILRQFHSSSENFARRALGGISGVEKFAEVPLFYTINKVNNHSSDVTFNLILRLCKVKQEAAQETELSSIFIQYQG